MQDIVVLGLFIFQNQFVKAQVYGLDCVYHIRIKKITMALPLKQNVI